MSVFNKEMPKEQLLLHLEQVKEALKSSCDQGEALDSKINNMLFILIPTMVALVSILLKVKLHLAASTSIIFVLFGFFMVIRSLWDGYKAERQHYLSYRKLSKESIP